jgi:hypothetical protein
LKRREKIGKIHKNERKREINSMVQPNKKARSMLNSMNLNVVIHKRICGKTGVEDASILNTNLRSVKKQIFC